jgi:hypothetical protein
MLAITDTGIGMDAKFAKFSTGARRRFLEPLSISSNR